MSFGRLLPLHNPSPFGDKAIIQKTEAINLDLRIDAAAAGVFKIPAEQEIDDALA